MLNKHISPVRIEAFSAPQDNSMRNNYTNKIIEFKQANRRTSKKIVYKVRGGGANQSQSLRSTIMNS